MQQMWILMVSTFMLLLIHSNEIKKTLTMTGETHLNFMCSNV